MWFSGYRAYDVSIPQVQIPRTHGEVEQGDMALQPQV